MTEEQQPLTPEEEEQLKELFGAGFPKPAEKDTQFSFFKDIIKAKDTTKVANLKENEIQAAKILQQTALYAESMGLDEVSKYLKQEAEIGIALTDSREGFLIRQSQTQRRQLTTQQKVEGGKDKGWFKSKEKNNEES